MSAVPNIPETLQNSSREQHLEASVSEALSKASLESQSRVDSPTSNGFSSAAGNTASFALHDTPVENQRPMRVIVVGAGYSGIYHGIRIPERLKNCELVIYDKNAGVGGTWYENRYPGCACDIPCKSLLASFDDSRLC